jgi:hypothetical protein
VRKDTWLAPAIPGMRTAIEIWHTSRTALSVMIRVFLLECISKKLVPDSSWYLSQYVQCKTSVRVFTVPEDVRDLNFLEWIKDIVKSEEFDTYIHKKVHAHIHNYYVWKVPFRKLKVLKCYNRRYYLSELFISLFPFTK